VKPVIPRLHNASWEGFEAAEDFAKEFMSIDRSKFQRKKPRHFFTSNPSSKREWNMKSRKGQKRFETFIYIEKKHFEAFL